ncbi:MAG: DUF2628 domain-containing protein [Clostridia bacterium]|nr:DUF2628 domain-containing protein [Clostridia bacterium]
MSYNIEGKQCKVCNAYLFEEDDVVFCPVCGAPHHRECYNSLGHCALEELHGTERQYDSSKEESKTEKENIKTEANAVKVKCALCGEEYNVNEAVCPNCSTPNSFKTGGRFVTFDFLGGVPADMDLGEGVTAAEAKKFVFSNTQRFIPKFARMKNGQKASFNILAFFFPCAWALSRKMYKLGAFIGALEVAFSMLMMPFNNVIKSGIPQDVAQNSTKLATYLMDNIKFFRGPALYFAFAASTLTVIMRIIIGIFGDYFYRNHTLKTVSSIKKSGEDIEENMRKKGGVSLLLLILGILITDYLPVLIASFAGI